MTDITTRAEHRCELCESTDDLAPWPVAPRADDSDDDAHRVLGCGACRAQLADGATLDDKHWFCLQTAIWSPVPAVQVVAWRLLQRLRAATWAQDLLDQAYLDDDTLAWARAGIPAAGEGDAATPTRDSNGAILADGDSVTLIKDLDVKGAGFVAKRGTLVKGVRLTDDPTLVEGKVNGVQIYLVTAFLKRVG